MNRTHIEINDKRTGDVRDDAFLCWDLVEEDLIAAEADWSPVRARAIKRLLSEGCPVDQMPQHRHWNWEWKAAKLKFASCMCFGIECENRFQGLLMATTPEPGGYLAELDGASRDRNKQLVYVDYLEVAPWNVKELAPTPLFGGIGSRLYEAAIRLSLREECCGRVGLHALPQAMGFYEKTCGMKLVYRYHGPEDLPYYEATREMSQAFLNGGK